MMGSPPSRHEAISEILCVVALAGMAYCHIKDVGMKLDERVYYMAALFCCNIAASLVLIPLVVYASRLPARLAMAVWASAGALAALTIVGFLWSRTIGFPQMDDHVGEWNALGIASLLFEALAVTVSVSVLVRHSSDVTRTRATSLAGVGGGGR